MIRDRNFFLTEVVARNALRRAHCLPLLNVDAEVSKALQIQRWQWNHVFRQLHKAERDVIAYLVIKEQRVLRNQPNWWPTPLNGGYPVSERIEETFRPYLKAIYWSRWPVS